MILFKNTFEKAFLFEYQYDETRASQAALAVKSLPANARDIRTVNSITRSGRSPRSHGNPLQYSCLENPVDREAWGVGGRVQSKGCKELNTIEVI